MKVKTYYVCRDNHWEHNGFETFEDFLAHRDCSVIETIFYDSRDKAMDRLREISDEINLKNGDDPKFRNTSFRYNNFGVNSYLGFVLCTSFNGCKVRVHVCAWLESKEIEV